MRENTVTFFAALAASLLAGLLFIGEVLGQVTTDSKVTGIGGGSGGVTSVGCTAPLVCTPTTGAAAFTWSGATLTGTPAAGDLSYWTGANTEGLVLNSSGSAGKVLTWASGAAPTWSAAAGGAALSAITAAAGANTIASGNNTGQIWNWANTTDSTIAFTFGETSAATNGTSTAGVPNQALLKLTTAAASTESPLTIYSRGSHVASVSPSTAQILATDGTASAPPYSFASDLTTGIYQSGAGSLRFTAGGTLRLVMAGSVNVTPGANNQPGLQDLNNATTGFSWLAANQMSVVDGTDGVWLTFLSRALQVVRGSADATAYAINARKARGTSNAPTVITTGDDLLTINGAGYLGATNTYVNAGRIRFDSIGTISDATTGIGGELVLATSKQGVDTAPADSYKIDQFGHLVSLVRTANTPTMGACGTSPTIVGTDDSFTVTVGTGGVATACVINFGTAYVTNPPNCSVLNNTDKVAYSTVEAVGSLTINAAAAFTASSKFKVLCKGFL